MWTSCIDDLVDVLPYQALRPTAGIPAELVAFGNAWGADPALGEPPLRHRLLAGREAPPRAPVERRLLESPGLWGAPPAPRPDAPRPPGVDYDLVELAPRCRAVMVTLIRGAGMHAAQTQQASLHALFDSAPGCCSVYRRKLSPSRDWVSCQPRASRHEWCPESTSSHDHGRG